MMSQKMTSVSMTAPALVCSQKCNNISLISDNWHKENVNQATNDTTSNIQVNHKMVDEKIKFNIQQEIKVPLLRFSDGGVS